MQPCSPWKKEEHCFNVIKIISGVPGGIKGANALGTRQGGVALLLLHFF